MEDTCDLDYKSEYKKLQEKMNYEVCRLKEENEKKMISQQEFYSQVIETKDEEIEFLKGVVKGVLHI